MKSTEDKFFARIWKTPDGCWAWQRSFTGNGYGRFQGRRAHRFAFEFFKHGISPGAVVRHTCDNKICVNPDHLVLGTQRQNMQDAVSRKRIATGGKNGRSRLKEADVLRIRQNPDGLTLTALAKEYGISLSAAHYIRSGRSWKMVGVTGLEPVTSPM